MKSWQRGTCAGERAQQVQLEEESGSGNLSQGQKKTMTRFSLGSRLFRSVEIILTLTMKGGWQGTKKKKKAELEETMKPMLGKGSGMMDDDVGIHTQSVKVSCPQM